MSLLLQSLVQLRRDEGEVLHAYEDHLGFLTIGVGVLIDKRKGGGITPEESAFLFRNRFNMKWDELIRRAPWIASLSEARQGVFINMAYQLGVSGLLNFKKALAYAHQGEYEACAREMKDSTWYNQTPERAERLCEQMRKNKWM